MKILLHDNGLHARFAPLSLTRPIGNIRMGIFTNDERWKLIVPSAEIFYTTEKYLSQQFLSTETPDLIVNAALIPHEEVAVAILNLGMDEQLFSGEDWLATKGTGNTKVEYTGEHILLLSQRWHLYQHNDRALTSDFHIVTAGRKSQKISKSNTILGDPSLIFLEEGAKVEASILNTETGPIYLAKDAEIMEGSIIRGGLALGEHSTLKLGTKVYGATTIGPHCKVGGEISNALFQSYSNKGHEGFLGNSLIGEWCNLGADTNTSNLKNNYASVSTYSYEAQKEITTDIQFMGLTLGDHSKCGINTMFNTASVVGVSSNIVGAGFPSKYIPSFSWCTIDSTVDFRFDKAIEYANNMMARRGLQLSKEEIAILKHINTQNNSTN